MEFRSVPDTTNYVRFFWLIDRILNVGKDRKTGIFRTLLLHWRYLSANKKNGEGREIVAKRVSNDLFKMEGDTERDGQNILSPMEVDKH